MNDNLQFVEVLVNKNIGGLYKTYQYKVPQELKQEIGIGRRVIVPFGNTLVDGFVLQLEDKAVTTNIKEVVSVVDNELTLEKDLLDLACWMSGQYLCPLALCLRCFLPLGSISKVRKFIYINQKNINEDINTKEKKIVEYILKKGKVLKTSLKRKFLDSERIIKGLKAKGIIKEKYEFDFGTKKPKLKRVYLNLDPCEAEKRLNPRAVKQKEIIKYLTEENGVLLKELLDSVNCNYGSVKNLQEKGIVTIDEQEPSPDTYYNKSKKRKKILLPEQQKVLARLREFLDYNKASRYLLHGITGSGKTEIYLRLIATTMKAGKQVIVLVPEISLTLELVESLKREFGNKVAVFHSGITNSEKYRYWVKIKKGECSIIVGARSAVFAPCKNLGLIIIDEEHEWTYKQDINPKYHTKEIAWKRIQMSGGLLLLGSATPSVETYWKAKNGDLGLLQMKKRVNNKPLPRVKIVDMRKEFKEGNYNIFSRDLINELDDIVKKNESAILFVNRRGFASFIICKSCGFVVECPNCKVTLTLHKDKELLQCHYCHHKQPIPPKCPRCKEKYSWNPHGIGTQRVEEELVKRFGKEKIFRIDSDTTSKKGNLEKLLEGFGKNGGILVGTQMIAKGLNFLNVTLVGVVDADSILNLPDFRARERSFQLLTQVAGRAGRGSKEGKVIIQTFAPDDPSIIATRDYNYFDFYQEEIRQRKMYEYPPFVHLLRILVTHSKEERVQEAVYHLKLLLKNNCQTFSKYISILGPAPAPISRIKNKYRWQLIIKSKNLKLARQIVSKCLKKYFSENGTAVKVDVDINPLGMI